MSKIEWFYELRKYLPIAFLLVIACDEKEENYSIEPTIRFVSIQFDEGASLQELDVLILTFSFTDGDSDFGLNEAHKLPPYHRYFFVHKSTGEMITSDRVDNGEISEEELIRYSDKVNAPFDTLPEPDEGCFYQAYSTGYVYSITNENHSNIFLDFFYEDMDGGFVELDFQKTYCLNYDGRVFSGSGSGGPFVRKMPNSKKGEIQYTVRSLGFAKQFGDRKMKLRISIQDRALHRSNVVETPEFYLDDI